MKKLALLIMFELTGCTRLGIGTTGAHSGNAIFMVAGQSNAFGPLQAEFPPADGRIIEDYQNTPPRQGPAYPFAEKLLTDGKVTGVKLVYCAYGGTQIEFWQKGVLYSSAYQTPVSLYQRCIARVNTAMDKNSYLAGIIFDQGEADSGGKPYWATMFLNIISNWRADLHSPALPIIFTQISSYTGALGTPQGWAEIQAQQAEVQGPNIGMVTTDQPPCNATVDGVHHTYDANRAIGEKMAAVYESLGD
jgi:hypothetical protein